MAELLQLLFGVLFISAKVLPARAAVYSSPDTALRFSQCLIEKMGESQFFTEEDRNGMTEVADVLAKAMKDMEYGWRGPLSVKILLSAFVTSLSHIVVLEEVSRNVYRKGVYEMALEQCSIATTQYIDADFIMESLRMVSALEETLVPSLHKDYAYAEMPVGIGGPEAGPQQYGAFDSRLTPTGVFNPQVDRQPSYQFDTGLPATGIFGGQTNPQPSEAFGQAFSAAGVFSSEQNPQTSNVFPPYAVVPSAAQNPFVQAGSNINAGTVFDLPDGHLDFDPFLPASHLDANSRFSSAPERNAPLPLLPVLGSSSQAGKDASPAYFDTEKAQSEVDYSPHGTFALPAETSGNLNTPLTKDSKNLYPPVPSQNGTSVPFQNQTDFEYSKNFQNPISTESKSNSSSLDIASLSSDLKKPFVELPESSDSLTSGSVKQSPDFNGPNVPQMKESAVRVIPPKTEANPTKTFPSEDQGVPENSKNQPPSTQFSSAEKESSFTMTTPALLPQTDRQVPSDQTLESIVSNILTNSSIFMNAFNSGISPENALNLARFITEQSLTGYNSDVIREALNAVSNAVANVKISSPENYASALSKALTSILKLHNLPLFADGSKIATSMLSKLPRGNENIGTQFKENFNSSESVQWEVKQLPYNSQSQPAVLEKTYRERFCDSLTRFLLEADDMDNFFCRNYLPQYPIPIYFGMARFSLLEYGDQVASVGASITAAKLSELSREDLCSNYAQTIAEVITDVLDENGFLGNANAEDISNRMAVSLNQQFADITHSYQPETVVDSSPEKETPNMPSEPTAITQSFSSNLTKSDEETSALRQIYSQSPTYSDFSSPDTNYKAVEKPSSEKFSIQPASQSSSDSYSLHQISPTGVLQGGYDSKNDYASPSPIDISDDEFTTISPCEETVSTLSESLETMSYSADDESPEVSDEAKDQTGLSSHLLSAMGHFLDAFKDVYSDEETQTDLPPHATNTGNGRNPMTNNSQINPFDYQTEESNPSRNSSQSEEKQNGSGTREFQYESPSPQIKESTEEDASAQPESQVKNRSSRRQPPPSFDSRGYNIQLPPVSLQPSFKNSQFSDSLPSASGKELPLVQTRYYDYDYEDASVVFAKAVSQFAAESIAFIRSGNFNMWALCTRLNELAPILKIPPLGICGEVPVIDYLLHVLQAVIRILKGV